MGFVYGGTTSRFWVHRKHINAMPPDKICTLPFNSWDCITLQLKHRDVDLVIRSGKQMNMFLKFLIYSLRTFDGKRGTAKDLVKALQRQEVRRLKKEQGRQVISESKRQEIKERSEYTVYRRVYFKYQVLKIRHKISYSAFEKRMTIPELLCRQILTTYDLCIKEERFTEDLHKRQMQDKIYEQISTGLTGQFRTLVLNTIAEHQLWDQINEYEFYKIM